jgi:long-chain acyl-CoA synthetase
MPGKTAIVCGEERWTYKALDRHAQLLAEKLSKLGLKKGGRVVIYLDNSPEVVISLYGILKAGGVFVILDSFMKAPKLRYILKDSGAMVMITHTDKAGIANEVLADLPSVSSVIWAGNASLVPANGTFRSISWEGISDRSPGNRAKSMPNAGGHHDAVNSTDQDLAALVYTSGSTGEPKGVMSSHNNMVSVSRSIIQYLENTENDIILNVLPLSFGYGLYQVIMSVMFCGTVVLERSFLYPMKVLELIDKERVTGFPIVPTMAVFMVNMQDVSGFHFRSLRYWTNAAAALPQEHISKLRAMFCHARLYSMYGLTECARVSYLPPEELERRPTSVGKAIPNCEVHIVDESGREVRPGESGELVVRGSNVMLGYWNAPEQTELTFRRNGLAGERLLYSGDLFKKDDEGFLFFIGRKDDMLKIKGERVSPREIENLLCSMDGIEEAAVIGISDELFGHAVKAFVVTAPGVSIRERDILKFCSDKIEKIKIPKQVEFITNLPKLANGKINKNLLKAQGAGTTTKKKEVKNKK